MKIRFKKLSENAVMPKKAHKADAGFDLTATQDYIINENGRVLIDTGIAVEIPNGYFGMVTGRSGNTIRYGLVGQLGIIDSGYTGSIGVMLFNTTKFEKRIRKGERVGQLIIMPAPEVEFEEADKLSESDRGTGGYGSTGM